VARSFLLVAAARSWPFSAWISRWIAAGFNFSVGIGEDCFVMLIDGVVVARPSVQGLRCVVLLGHFRAIADLGDSACVAGRSSWSISDCDAQMDLCSAERVGQPVRLIGVASGDHGVGVADVEGLDRRR
jgi:hypothetical protein